MSNNNGMSLAGLICGIASIVFAFLVWWLGVVLGILGIIFSAIGRSSSAQGSRGMATAGLICGIIGVALVPFILICSVCVAGTAMAGMLAYM